MCPTTGARRGRRDQLLRSIGGRGRQSQALAIMDDVYEICDRPWRGLGVVPGGGFRLRVKWASLMPRSVFPRIDCRAGVVRVPQRRSAYGPDQADRCEHFGVRCTPDSPMGRQWSRPKEPARHIIAMHLRAHGATVEAI